MYIKHAQSKIAFKHISKDVKLYLGILRNGLPSFIRQGLNSISSGILNNLAGYYGSLIDLGEHTAADATIAAMSDVNRISNFVMCVGLGIGQGLQPVASFNYQAKKYGRVKRALAVTSLIGLGFIVVLATPMIIAPEFFIRLLKSSDDVVKIGAPALRYAMIGQLFVPLFIPINMLYQSIRKAWIASFLALLRSGLLFIPILFAATALWQITGVQIAQPVADVLTGLISLPFLIHFMKTTPNDEPDADTNDNNGANDDVQSATE